MIVSRALRHRWERAQQYASHQVVHVGGDGWRVESSGRHPDGTPGHYPVTARMADGKLVFGRCTCPDWGTVEHHGIPVCKHVLAAALATIKRKAPDVEKAGASPEDRWIVPIPAILLQHHRPRGGSS